MPDSYTGPLYFDRLHFGSMRLAAAVPAPRSETVTDTRGLAQIVRRHRLVSGHYSASTMLHAGCTALAVQLREPRSRLLSLYRYWRGQAPADRAGWGVWSTDLVAASDEPFSRFLRNPALWPAIDNQVARQLLLAHTHPSALSARSARRTVGQTLGYMRMRRRLALCEWHIASERFVERISATLGVSDVPTPLLVNESSGPGEPQRIDAPTYRRLLRFTSHDRAMIERLMHDGLLPRRGVDDLDREFTMTAERLGFELP